MSLILPQEDQHYQCRDIYHSGLNEKINQTHLLLKKAPGKRTVTIFGFAF